MSFKAENVTTDVAAHTHVTSDVSSELTGRARLAVITIGLKI